VSVRYWSPKGHALRHLFTIAALSVLLPLSAVPQNQTRLEQRIQRVETGLMPESIAKGESVPKWTISERMAHYNVVGVSVAIVDNYTIHWAKGYGLPAKMRIIRSPLRRSFRLAPSASL